MRNTKRLIICSLAFILLFIGILGVTLAPKDPIIVKKLSSANAEEIVEYTEEIPTKKIETIQDDLNLCIIGNATKSVTPDLARITAVIETLDLDIKKSKDTNFDIFDKVVDGLSKAGVSKDNIVVDSYTSYPSYDYNAGKTLVGYYSITTFSFDVESLDNLKNLIDVAMENGTTSIRNVVYKISNMEEVYADVLLDALENAKVKAQKISGKEDMQVKSIKEEYVYSCSSLYKTYNEGLDDTTMIGSVDVQARVVVEFK